ncbi:MAG: hypothetical protein J6O50_11085 [Ruminiclostridium sp.]|nr:hypothetical protein [Ruminiclostridium sp.]
MRREELFIDILGGLDEKYVSLAMPRSCGYDIPDDTRKTVPLKPVEVAREVSMKDRVIYWVTHTLGMAAVVALIVGAAVFLVQNWDKIAVSGGERPGTIVKYIDELPDISEAYGKTIEFSDASVRFSSVAYDGARLNTNFYLLYKGNDEFYSPAVWINVEGAEHGDPSCAINPVMEADSYDYLIQCSVPVELEPGNSYAVNIVYKGNGNLENDTQKYRFNCPNIPAVTAETTTNNPYLTSAVEALIEPVEADTFTYDRPSGSWFELEETLYRIDYTAPFDCVTFNDDGTCSSIFIDEWKEEYDAIGYKSELENITDENFVFTFGFMKQPGEEPRSGSDPDLTRVYSADYKNADKGEALAMRNKYVTMPLNENQIMYIDKYMRGKLNVPYDSIVWDDVYGVYYVDTQKRCELMPDRYYSEVNDDLRHDLFEAMYEADRNSEMDGNPGTTYYHTNPLPIVGSDEYIGFWASGSYNAKIIAAYIIKRDFEGQYRADMKTDITDELDRLYLDGAKLMFVKSGGGYYAVTESNRKIELIPGDEGAVSNYEAKFAYRVRPYLPLPDGAAEDIKLGEEQKRLLIKEAYESAQSFENSIPLDRLAVSDPVKISEQQFFIFVFDGDEIVGKIWCFYSDSTENASGFDTGGYDNAVDGLTELYRSGEKVSFTWFGSNLYCCPENAVSCPIEWQVFHKPSVVYLYNAEQGAPIHRNNAE